MPTSAPAEQRPKRLTTRQRAAARRAAREAARQKQLHAERHAWLRRLAARDVEPWPEAETDDEHAAALAKSRAMIDEVKTLAARYGTVRDRAVPVRLEHPGRASRPVCRLSRPHVRLDVPALRRAAGPQGVARRQGADLRVPRATISSRPSRTDTFPKLAKRFARSSNIYGLCHLSPNGEVVIACYRGNDPNDFGQMLVHETSHGFIHRYKTKAQLPNWVDEGMADLIGAEMVPASTAVQEPRAQGQPTAAERRSLGGMLSAKRIEAWQYGVASSLNRFLLQTNRESYVRFIEALKEGMKWEEALREAYGSTPDELLAHYGRWISVADLRP